MQRLYLKEEELPEKLPKLDEIAARLAAQNIARWFNTVSADELADYLINDADMAAMLPMTLTLPTFLYRMTRRPLLNYLKNVLYDSLRKAVLYEVIRRTLANPDIFGERYQDHCLLLGWGLYTDPEKRKHQLARFPCLAGLSSAQPWYHANMDRVLKRIISQLEGDVKQHDTGRANRIDSTGSGRVAGGPGTAGVLGLEARVRNIDLPAAVSDQFPGSAADLDQIGCDVVDFGCSESS